MKRIVLALVLISIIVISLGLSSCSLTKSTKVFVEDREISSIKMIVYTADAQSKEYKFTKEEISSLKKMFDNLGYIERQYVSNPIISESFDYTLEFNVAKKGVKKAYKYYVYVGRTYTYSIDDKQVLSQTESKYLSIATDQLKYKGEVNEEILNYLSLAKASII